MTISRRRFTTILACASAFALAPIAAPTAVAGPASQLTIVTEHYPPYNFEDHGEIKGISVDLMVAMLEQMQADKSRADIKLMPWARGYDMALNNPNTVLFATTRTAARENLFKWVGPIAATKIGLTARKASGLKIASASDIGAYKVGTIRDDVGEQLLKQAGVSDSAIQPAAKNIDNIRKLQAGRIDAWSYEVNVAKWDIKENGFNPDDFEVVFELSEGELFYAFQKDTPDDVITAFQGALDALKASGTYEAIVARYVR